MKIFNKLLLLAGMACVAFASCESEYPEYQVGEQAAQDSTVVFFKNPKISSIIVGVEDSTLEIGVCRYATEAASYALTAKVSDADKNLIKVPSFVTFDEGCKDTTFVVELGDLELMKSYFFTIVIDESVTNPYKESTDYTQIVVNLMKEDYMPYAEGIYNEPLLLGAELPVLLQYSPSLELYRLKNCWGKSDVTLIWDESTIVVTPEKVAMGYTYGAYGAITAEFLNDYCYAVCDTTESGVDVTMNFGVAYTVSAGTITNGYNTFEFVVPNTEAAE